MNDPTMVEQPAMVARAGPVRIGAVSYLNARPLVEGLERCRDAVVTFDVPARLLGALLEERVDVALAPVMDALTSPEALAALPVGCIASDGATRSVALFSRTPIGAIRTVLTDAESRTSAALCEILLRKRYGSSAEVSRAAGPIAGVAARATDADAVLLIGDKVERDPPDPADFPHRLDLGAAWKEWTGGPFVYAAWVCLASRASEPVIARGRDLLDRQRRRNAMRIGWIADRRAPEHGWRTPEARAYLHGVIGYDFTEAHRRAVERFAAEAVALSLAPARARVRWAD